MKPEFKLDLKNRCKYVLEDKWDMFRLEHFKPAVPPKCGNQDPKMFEKKLHNRSLTLMQAGEIGRSYKYLQNEFVPVIDTPGVLKDTYIQKLASKVGELNLPDLGTTASKEIELDPELVFKSYYANQKVCYQLPDHI